MNVFARSVLTLALITPSAATPAPTPSRSWAPQFDAAGDITNFAALPARTWTAIPKTAMESTIKPILDAGGYTLYQAGDSKLSAVMDNYSGMAWDHVKGRGWAFGGGHHGGTDNGIYEVNLNKMKWSIASYPSHPTRDFTRQQYAYYTLGARRGGIGTTTVHVFPLKESSTGYAIKADQGFSSTRWYAVTGPERDVSGAVPVFPNGDTWAQAGNHPVEHTLGGNQNFALFDGRPVSMHTYNGFVYVRAGLKPASYDGPVLVTRAYWKGKTDGTGWIKYPNPGAGVAPTRSSGENIWVQTDEKTGKIWWGGCGSGCWDGNYYFYGQGYILDPVTMTDSPSPRLVPDSNLGVKVNAGDQMFVSFKAGRKIGGWCVNMYGWTYDLDTGARQLLSMSGRPYSGAKGEGKSSIYIPHLGKLWLFDTSVASLPVWSMDIDHPQPGGPNGSFTVVTQPETLANAAALPWSGNGLVFSRLTYWEKHKLIVYFPGTQHDAWVARIP